VRDAFWACVVTPVLMVGIVEEAGEQSDAGRRANSFSNAQGEAVSNERAYLVAAASAAAIRGFSFWARKALSPRILRKRTASLA
jgi:hypothetical protein